MNEAANIDKKKKRNHRSFKCLNGRVKMAVDDLVERVEEVKGREGKGRELK